MKVTLKFNSLELIIDATTEEMYESFGKPLFEVIPLVLPQLLDRFVKKNDSGLREKLEKEDKRLELAIPKLKEMIRVISLQLNNEQEAFDNANDYARKQNIGKHSDFQSKLGHKHDSLLEELDSIHSRRKLIVWALSNPDGVKTG